MLSGGRCSIAYHELYLRLKTLLPSIMLHPSLDSFFFVSSESEAIDAALKMVRGITHKQNIVTMQGAYRGGSYESNTSGVRPDITVTTSCSTSYYEEHCAEPHLSPYVTSLLVLVD